MSEIQMAHFSFGGQSREQRRFHEVALAEARAAADHHETAAEAPRSRFGRLGIGCLRLALAGGPATTEACNCPA